MRITFIMDHCLFLILKTIRFFNGIYGKRNPWRPVLSLCVFGTHDLSLFSVLVSANFNIGG